MKEIYPVSVIDYWIRNNLENELVKRIQAEGDFVSVSGVRYFVIVN